MTERQRNYWLQACTEAKGYVILNKSKLAKFKQLEDCLKYLEVAKVNDIATYIKLHPSSDVAYVVMAATMQTESTDEILKSLSSLNDIREIYIQGQLKAASKVKIDDQLEKGETSNDTNAN